MLMMMLRGVFGVNGVIQLWGAWLIEIRISLGTFLTHSAQVCFCLKSPFKHFPTGFCQP